MNGTVSFPRQRRGAEGFWLLIFLSFSACVDKIDLSVPPIDGGVLIMQGKLLYGRPSQALLSITRVRPPNGNSIIPVSALAFLEDEQGRTKTISSIATGEFSELLDPDDPGFPIEEGKKYRINAVLPDGRKYQSGWDELLPLVEIDSFAFRLAFSEYVNDAGTLVRDTFARFSVNTNARFPNSGKPAQLRWELDQAFKLMDFPTRTLQDLPPPKLCYVIQKMLDTKVAFFNGRIAGTTQLADYEVITVPVGYEFAEAFYGTVYQQSITENTCAYFEEVNLLLSKTGTIFDPPVGELRSNIRALSDDGGAIQGFFYVANQDTARLYITPAEVGNPRKYCPRPERTPPPPTIPPGVPDLCEDCLISKGAQLEKPAWWEH